MRHWSRAELKKAFPVSLKDAITATKGLFLALVFSLLLDALGVAQSCAPMIFVLAVFLISRLTEGYLWGLLASLFSVFLVNYAFTYPYFSFNLMIAGYPITFITMFAVSILTSTLTTRAREQERLRAENEKERTRANLLRAVSHDIRTPLTAISGAVDTVLEQQDTMPKEQQAELLGNAREEAQWLIRMVENLLTVTRISDDTGGIKTQPEAAEEVLAGAVAQFRRRYPAACLTVSAPEEFLMVPMDATLIEQVLLNLLENAVLHGRTVTQLHMDVRKQNKYAVFSVQDNGSGIEESRLPTLFDGMRGRMELSSSDERNHMGIGLSVCRTIALAHKGELVAHNRPEGGAEFLLSLPLGEETPNE